MTRWDPRRRDDDVRDTAIDDPEVVRVLDAARAAPGTVDRAALDTALAAYRAAGATAGAGAVAAADTTAGAGTAAAGVDDGSEAPARSSRRRRVLEAIAATTLATKIVAGVATAAALGGIGVAVTETVRRDPAPTPSVSTPLTPAPSGSPSPTSDAPSGTSSPSSTATPGSTNTTDIDPDSPSPSGSRSPTKPGGSPSRSSTPSATTNGTPQNTDSGAPPS